MKTECSERIKLNRKSIVFGVLTIVVTTIITISYMHLWGTDINVPIAGYRSDSIGVLLEANNYVRGGDVHHNVCYGAPWINGYINTVGDSSVPIPFIGVLAQIVGSVEAGVNIHGILNYVLLALSMYWICCRLKIKEEIAMTLGICYSCLSYFVMYCNTLLLIYSYCFYIPLFCYIVIDLMLKLRGEGESKKYSIYDVAFIICVMLFVGLNSAYYAFFVMIMLAFVGLYVLISLKSVDKVLLVIVSYIAIGIGIAVYTLPNILYAMSNRVFAAVWNSGVYYCIWGIVALLLIGMGTLFYKKIYPHITMKTLWIILAGAIIVIGLAYIVLKKYTNYLGAYEGRTLHTVELGALNIVNIVLPAINNMFDNVNQELSVLIDLENQDVTALGVMTGIGFLYSVLGVFRFEKGLNHKDEIVRICGICNCFLVVLSIKGGGGSLIAACITTGIRAYSRICIIVAVFSLLALGILLDKIFSGIKTIQGLRHKRIVYVSVVIIVFMGLLLSCPTDFIVGDSFGLAEYEQRKREYDDWQQLMNEIEEVMPENSMVYELPTTIEGKHFGELMKRGRAYELSIPAILSKTTIWSYGSGWSTSVGIEETETFIKNVSDVGFKGIYIDTLLYSDDSYVQHIEALSRYLGEPIVCNEDRRYFFDISEYKELGK